ncbi:Ras family protein [Cooperia oncophora]
MTAKQYTFKILIIGDPGTGKTSIIRRFVHDVFTANYKATIGVDFAMKKMTLDDDVQAYLQIWDISGQDRYGVMTRVYYKDANAAIIVMDATNNQTKEGACRWKADLDQKLILTDGNHIPSVLVVNKCDLENDVSEEDLMTMKSNNGFVEVMRASAKEDFGIQEAFTAAVKRIIACERNGQYEMTSTRRAGNVFLYDNDKQQTKRPSCCISSLRDLF